MASSDQVVSLARVQTGLPLVVTEIRSVNESVLRLREMGLHEGARVQVRRSAGMLLCHLNNARLALEPSLAEHVFVRQRA